jgi:hypothetical protein
VIDLHYHVQLINLLVKAPFFFLINWLIRVSLDSSNLEYSEKGGERRNERGVCVFRW